MRRLAVILTAAATVTAGLVAAPARAATLPSPPTTGYAIFTAPLPNAGWGTRFQATASASGSSTGGGGLTVGGFNATSDFARTFVSPPTGQSFAVGTYDINESATATQARVQIDSAAPSQCASTSGTLTVHEVTLAAGVVTAFAGSVRGNCGTGQPVFAQEIRWNSTVPMIVLTAPVSTSTSEVVTVQAGASAATFGDPIGTGTDAKLTVTANTCSGRTVAADTTCSLTLTATPDFFGPAQDLITLPDGGSGRKIPVTVDGYDTATGAYTPLPPARLLDTRKKVGVTTTTPIGANKSIDLQVTGRGGVPASGVGSVVLNVTVAQPTTAGFVTLHPTGSARPGTSSVNFNAGWTGANLVTVKVGTGGKVRVYNAAGNTHVLADVVGYYHAASSTVAGGYGGYSAIEPTRILDSRGLTSGALSPNEYYTTGLNFGSADNPHIKAYAVNVTVNRPTGSGFLTAWNGDAAAVPGTSTLNFTAGRTVPNMAVVPTRPCGVQCADPTVPLMGVLNGSTGNAHVIVDLVGVYDDNTFDGMWRFRPLTEATRIVDTRAHQGIPAALGPGGAATVTAPAPVTTYNSMALVTNTTANRPTVATVLTLWNADFDQPAVSNLNPAANQLVSNMTITDLGAAYDFTVGNAVGTTNLVLDVAGTMETYPAVADPGAGAALRADGLTALRSDAAQRATGDPRATGRALTGTPVTLGPRHR